MKDSKIKVGVLRGGSDKHYLSSIFRGGDIISHFFDNLSEKYKIIDILIDKSGDWYINGLPIKPMDLVYKVDVLWNNSQHPEVSAILNRLSISNVDNGSFSKILEKNKNILNKHMKDIGIKMPKSIILPLYQEDFDGPRERYSIKKAKEILEKFSSPWIVKSYTPDLNEGIHLAKTFPELVDAIEDGVKHQKSILVEEFILGKVTSIHSVTGFRGEDIYIFPSEDIKNNEKEKIFTLIKDMHRHLGIKYYLKSDFVFHPKRGLFLTDINLSPDLRKGSHFEQACEFVGAKMHHITEHILEKALDKGI